jgi:hypothetical protein
MSPTRRVVAAVPPLTHGSTPWFGVRAVKNTDPLDARSDPKPASFAVGKADAGPGLRSATNSTRALAIADAADGLTTEDGEPDAEAGLTETAGTPSMAAAPVSSHHTDHRAIETTLHNGSAGARWVTTHQDRRVSKSVGQIAVLNRQPYHLRFWGDMTLSRHLEVER